MIDASQRDRAQYLLDEIAWLALFPERDQVKAFHHIAACRRELVQLLRANAGAELDAVLAFLDRIIGIALFPSDRTRGMDAGELMRVAVLRANVEAQLDNAAEPRPDPQP